MKVFSPEALLVYQVQLPDVKYMGPAGRGEQSNPIVTKNRMFGYSFSPGFVFALRANDEKVIWRKKLSNYGGAVNFHGQKVYSTCSHEIVAYSATTGKVFWKFCPQGKNGEWIYSCPTFDGKRLYLGDRAGFLHCLKADSGKLIWSTQVADGQAVNGSAVVAGDLVITGTNEPSAVALNKHTGEIEWKRKLDASCGDQLVVQGGQAVAVTKKSIYFLALESGKVTSRIKRRGRVRLGNPVVAGKLVCVLETDNRIRKISCNKLLLIEDHQLKKVVSLRPRILINYSYFKNKDALYISHFHGLDIFDIKTRKVKIQIKKKNIFFATVAAVVGRRIYVFDQYGKLYVMRDPSSPVSRS